MKGQTAEDLQELEQGIREDTEKLRQEIKVLKSKDKDFRYKMQHSILRRW